MISDFFLLTRNPNDFFFTKVTQSHCTSHNVLGQSSTISPIVSSSAFHSHRIEHVRIEAKRTRGPDKLVLCFGRQTNYSTPKISGFPLNLVRGFVRLEEAGKSFQVKPSYLDFIEFLCGFFNLLVRGAFLKHK